MMRHGNDSYVVTEMTKTSPLETCTSLGEKLQAHATLDTLDARTHSLSGDVANAGHPIQQLVVQIDALSVATGEVPVVPLVTICLVRIVREDGERST